MGKTKKRRIKVLFAAFEAEPFIKTGGLGDIAGSLPGAVTSAAAEVRVILPNLAQIPEEYRALMRPVDCFEVELGWRRQYCGLLTLERGGTTYYFVDNEYYFRRANVYGEYDDGERIAFFSKAVLECAIHMPDFTPDIIHANDWHTALVPVYLREQYMGVPGFDRMKTVFTIHNLKFQGIFPGGILGDVLGLHDCPAAGQLMYGGAVNYMQGAVRYSDRITTVSPTYAREITTPEYGEGMDWLFRERRNVLTGILNGIDNAKYDPAKADAPFGADTLEIKRANKAALQGDLGLEQSADTPLFVLVSRLTEQKGVDLVTAAIPSLIGMGAEVAVLGVGEARLEQTLRWYASAHPGKVSATLSFSDDLARRLYACGDILLMPSRFEPCGLAQMMAMRYGTLPLVRETGGLADSVVPYNRYTGEGTGFSFRNYDAGELISAAGAAVGLMRDDPAAWEGLVRRAMAADFSWSASAARYLELYKELLGI